MFPHREVMRQQLYRFLYVVSGDLYKLSVVALVCRPQRGTTAQDPLYVC